jgi:peroxiredoxin
MLREDRMALLQNGQRFPTLRVLGAGGNELLLPDALAGSYGVILIYRGSRRPYCLAQLAAFNRARTKLVDVNVKVVALSVDDEATTRATIDKYHLQYPVGHSADADAVAALVGSYTNEHPKHLQSTGFVLAPDGTLVCAVYSSGAIGRLVPDDVAGLAAYHARTSRQQ